MNRDNEVPQDPDLTVNDATDFDTDATIEQTGEFAAPAGEKTQKLDPDATTNPTADADSNATVDPDATVEQIDPYDPNATIEETTPFDPDVTLDVDPDFDGDATIEQTSEFDPDATVEAVGGFDSDATVDSSRDLELTVGGEESLDDEGRSVLERSDLSQTINPRALSAAEAKYWADISAEFTSPNDSTVQPLAVERTIVETRLQLRSQTVATQIHDDNHLADYRLVRLLGRGGMGNVFVARQGSLDRLIAVKVIRPLDESKREKLAQQGQLESVEQGRRQQFLTEAVVTGDLDHPNIVPIHDVAVTGESTLFYSMKRVIGTPWSDVIGEKTRDENLEILIKVADAIGYAHSRGVVHRDIKPENVMLGDFGVVMVMDWGIALAQPDFEKLDSITPATGLGGTPSMMSPEMATGPLEQIGPAADIYLLGATLFMIITGKPPHHAPNVSECLRAVATNEIRPFDTKHQGELMNIALKAMAMNPADRYADTKALQDAIRKYRSHAQSLALGTRANEDLRLAREEKSYTQFTRAQFGFEEAIALWSGNEAARDGLDRAKIAHAEAAYQNEDFDLGVSLLDEQNPDHIELMERLKSSILQRRQRKWRFAALKKVAAALLAFTLIGGSIAIFLINQARADADRNYSEAVRLAELAKQEERRADAKAAEAQKNSERAKAAQSKAEYEAYVSGVGLAKARIDRNEFTEARRLINNLIAQRDPNAIPWELRYLSSLADPSTASITTMTGGGGLAIARRTNEPDSRVTALIRSDKGALTAIRVSATADQPLQVATPRPLRLPNDERASCLAIADDNTLAAAGTEDGDILLFDPRSLTDIADIADVADVAELAGESLRRLVGHQSRVTAVQMIGNDFLISSSDDHTVRIWSISSGAAEQILWHIAPVVDLAGSVTPDGFRLAAAVSQRELGQVVVWDARRDDEFRAERRGVYSAHSSPLASVAISPDGQFVASGDVDGSVMLWPVAQIHRRDIESLVQQAVEMAGSSKPKSENATKRRTGVDASSWQFTLLSDPDLDTGESVDASRAARAHRSRVGEIRFSRDGQTLLTCGDDYLIHLWQIEPTVPSTATRPVSLRRTLRGHGGGVSDADFLSDHGDEVLSIGEDDSIRLWRSAAELAQSIAPNRDRPGVALESVEPANADGSAAEFCAELLRREPVRSHVHDDAISSAMLSADGQHVVTASRDRTAQVLTIDLQTLQLKTAAEMATGNAAGNEPRPSGTHPPPVISLDEGSQYRAMSICVNRAANRLFVGGADSVVRIWNLERGTELGTIPDTGLNQVLAVSADTGVMVTGSSVPETRAMLWRLDPQTSIPSAEHRLSGHQETLTAAAISRDGELALTADGAGRMILWDAAGGEAVGEPIDLLLGTRINDAVFSPEGESVWIAADDEQLSRLDLHSREFTDRLNHLGAVTRVELSDDGRSAVTSSELQKLDSTIHRAVFWQLPSDDVAAAHQTLVTQDVKSDERTRSGSRPGIASVSIDPSGDRALVAINPAGDAASRVECYRVDANAGQSTREIVLGLPDRLGDVSSAIPVGDDELITLHGNSAFRWNTASRSLEISYRIHGAISVAAISHDGAIVLTGSRSLKAWDAVTGAAIGKLETPHQGAVRAIAFAGETAPNEFFTSGDDGSIRRWLLDRDAGLFEQLETISSREDADEVGVALSLTVSPDGLRLLSTSDRGHVILIDLVEGDRRILFSDPDVDRIFAGCFSPDGRFVAAGGHDQLARMWDLSKPRTDELSPDAIFQGHAEAIRGIALIGTASRIDPPGQSTLRLFTASLDRSVRVWDPNLANAIDDEHAVADDAAIPKGRELLELVRHSGGVTAIDFNAAATLMMTAGSDGNVILWPACDSHSFERTLRSTRKTPPPPIPRESIDRQ